MKKILSVLLSTILILSTVFSGAVVTAATPVTFTLSGEATVNVGNPLNLTLSANNPFAVAVIDFAFDTSALKLTAVSNDIMFMPNSTGARVVFDGSSAQSGQIATLTFETLKSGTYPVNMSATNGNISDANADPITATFVNANVTITCTHQYVFSHIVDPTCKVEGKEVHICSICGEENPDPSLKIDKIEHIEGEVRVTEEPDCVNEGYKMTYCAICDEPMGSKITIPANGHTFGEWMIDEEPTCSQNGVKVHVCEVCGDEVAESISKTEHDSSAENATWVVIKPANCTTTGLKALICNDCGEQKDTQIIEATAHQYIMAVTKEATCTEAGEYSEVCRICGDIKQSTPIQKLPHTEGKVVIDKASCTKDGSETTYCSVCGEIISTRVLEKLDHVYSPLNVINPPTNDSTGTATHTCTLCDHTETVTLDITNAYLGAENLLIGKIEATKTVKLAVSVENSKLFYAGIFEVYYDSNALEYVGYEANGIDITINAATEGKIIVLITADSVLPNGKILDLLFNLKSKKGSSEITIKNASFSDGESDVFFNTQNGSLGVKYTLDGDVNNDGMVNVIDLGLLKKYVAGMVAVQNTDAADINYDGKVNITDLAILKKVVSGIITLD